MRALAVALYALAACGPTPPPAPSPPPAALPAAASPAPEPAPEPNASGRPLLVTVDDLPMLGRDLHEDPAERARITDELLGVLSRHGIQAIGFVTWSRVLAEGDRAVLARWLEAGHELGNHSFAHLSYTHTAADAYIADVEHGRAELAAFLGAKNKTPRFFRFPFLREGDTADKLAAMRAYLTESGQRNVAVTLDTQDWSFEEPWVKARRAGDQRALEQIGEAYQRSLRADIAAQLEEGDALYGRAAPQVLLLHATEIGAAQWDALFRWIEDGGQRFAVADEVLADPALTSLPDYVGDFGPGLWRRVHALRRRDKARDEVNALFATQARAWSDGRLEDFCAVYDEAAQFLSPSGLTVGRAKVLERYRKKYGSDKESMGELSLDVLELVPLDGTEVTLTGGAEPGRVHAVSVVARWKLGWKDKPEKSGLTLLVLRRGPAGWRIVHDASM